MTALALRTSLILVVEFHAVCTCTICGAQVDSEARIPGITMTVRVDIFTKVVTSNPQINQPKFANQLCDSHPDLIQHTTDGVDCVLSGVHLCVCVCVCVSVSAQGRVAISPPSPSESLTPGSEIDPLSPGPGDSGLVPIDADTYAFDENLLSVSATPAVPGNSTPPDPPIPPYHVQEPTFKV